MKLPTHPAIHVGRVKTVVALAAATSAAALGAGLAGCGTQAVATPQLAAARFLGVYVKPDGRVSRLDQGGDTVSEGQAYGMLLAEVAGDSAVFQRIWLWTHDHLQLRDGLFAFHANRNGEILGAHPASDADLLIAWALLRYRGPEATRWHHDGYRVADAILAHEVAAGSNGSLVLTAGPWARGSPITINPSYWSLSAMRGLAQLTGRDEWHRLAVSAVSLASHLSLGGRLLPPDWAQLSAGWAATPEPAPNGSAPQTGYGPNAERTVVWFAASCDPQARKLAARWWLLLRLRRRSQALTLGLNGAVIDGTRTGVSVVASAAAAHAAGDRVATMRLLRRADTLQQRFPTYYGGAWTALGRALLTSNALGACRH